MATPALTVQASETPLLCPGDLVANKYRIEEILGGGGMAVVYRAVHVSLGSSVAIKVVRRELAVFQSAAARMMLEARAVAALRSHHVARVFDVGRLESGLDFIVMEYLEGCDLYEVVRRDGPLPESLAVDYVLQACEGLAEAHAHGIVHRDLKPENLFVATTNDGRSIIKVLDFGVSKRSAPDGSARLTSPCSVVGSLHYMAPEQLRGADVDLRADVYSIGVILFELVSGAPPFDAESVPAVCAKVLEEPPPQLHALRPGTSAKLDAVIARCLRKIPEERFDNLAELAAALADLGSVAARRSAEHISRILARLGSGASAPERASALPTPMPTAAAELVLSTAIRSKAPRRWLAIAGTLAVLIAIFGSQLTLGDAQARERPLLTVRLAPSRDRVARALAPARAPLVDAARRPQTTEIATRLQSQSPRGATAFAAGGAGHRQGRPERARRVLPPAVELAAPPQDERLGARLDPWSPESFGNRH
jgi:predicted Ser/Thr protein kinase